MTPKVTEDQFNTRNKTVHQATKSAGVAQVKALTNAG